MRSRFLLILSFVTILVGQPTFTAATISNTIDYANSVYAIDMDSDGDIDILSGLNDAYGDGYGGIQWYENDGSESFTSHTIYSSASYAMSVFAIDVDGDGDIDVLSSSQSDDKIAWYENSLIH